MGLGRRLFGLRGTIIMDTTQLVDDSDFNNRITNEHIEDNAIFHAIFYEVCKREMPTYIFEHLWHEAFHALNVPPDELQQLIDDIAGSQVYNLIGDLPPLAADGGE
jgi:hypothetical protein